jgi:hypothetical protein
MLLRELRVGLIKALSFDSCLFMFEGKAGRTAFAGSCFLARRGSHAPPPTPTHTHVRQVLELLNAVVDGGHTGAQEAILREVLISATPSFLPALFATVRSYEARFRQKTVCVYIAQSVTWAHQRSIGELRRLGHT